MKQRTDKGRPRKNHVGEVYNRLTIIACAGQRSNRAYLWKCRCECGKEILTTIHELRSDRTKSCGCLRDENRKTQNGLGRDAAHVRTNTLKHLFKLTPEMVKQKLETQNDCCSICRQPFTETPTVDHDHACCSNGKNRQTCGRCVRGLLCKQCNAGLGNFKDNPQTLQNAILYLAEWTQK
jgi:hypothetical protein